MKIYGSTLLALAAFQPISAFVAPPAKALTFKGKTWLAVGSANPPPFDGAPKKDAKTGTALPQQGGPAGGLTSPNATPDMQRARNAWDRIPPTVVQGGALRTWSFPATERVLVSLATEENRQLKASIDLCQGPDNTPQRMDVTIGKGMIRPFKAVIETPKGSNSVFIRNQSPVEFPILARVEADTVSEKIYDMPSEIIIQGGAVRSYEIEPNVASVKVALKTDGRPLNARVELIQGPNTNKEVIELYTEDGIDRPFFTVITTPGDGNTVRIVNTATVEFPMTAALETDTIDESKGAADPNSSVFITGM